MVDLNRRGFLQLVGLGATGSLVQVPLFRDGQALASPSDLVNGHMVITRGHAKGVARLLMEGESAKRQGVLLHSTRRSETPATYRGGNDAIVAQRAKVFQKRFGGASLISLCLPHEEDGRKRSHREIQLRDTQDPTLVAYAEAHDMRQKIRDTAMSLLAEVPGEGWQIVTVVHEPLSWTISEGKLNIHTDYDHWLVRGEVLSEEVLSTCGECPISGSLDIEKLVWFDDRVQKFPELLGRVRQNYV